LLGEARVVDETGDLKKGAMGTAVGLATLNM
jgi:hypothetical protein